MKIKCRNCTHKYFPHEAESFGEIFVQAGSKMTLELITPKVSISAKTQGTKNKQSTGLKAKTTKCPNCGHYNKYRK